MSALLRPSFVLLALAGLFVAVLAVSGPVLQQWIAAHSGELASWGVFGRVEAMVTPALGAGGAAMLARALAAVTLLAAIAVWTSGLLAAGASFVRALLLPCIAFLNPLVLGAVLATPDLALVLLAASLIVAAFGHARSDATAEAEPAASPGPRRPAPRGTSPLAAILALGAVAALALLVFSNVRHGPAPLGGDAATQAPVAALQHQEPAPLEAVPAVPVTPAATLAPPAATISAPAAPLLPQNPATAAQATPDYVSVVEIMGAVPRLLTPATPQHRWPSVVLGYALLAAAGLVWLLRCRLPPSVKALQIALVIAGLAIPVMLGIAAAMPGFGLSMLLSSLLLAALAAQERTGSLESLFATGVVLVAGWGLDMHFWTVLPAAIAIVVLRNPPAVRREAMGSVAIVVFFPLLVTIACSVFLAFVFDGQDAWKLNPASLGPWFAASPDLVARVSGSWMIWLAWGIIALVAAAAAVAPRALLRRLLVFGLPLSAALIGYALNGAQGIVYALPVLLAAIMELTSCIFERWAPAKAPEAEQEIAAAALAGGSYAATAAAPQAWTARPYATAAASAAGAASRPPIPLQGTAAAAVLRSSNAGRDLPGAPGRWLAAAAVLLAVVYGLAFCFREDIAAWLGHIQSRSAVVVQDTVVLHIPAQAMPAAAALQQGQILPVHAMAALGASGEGESARQMLLDTRRIWQIVAAGSAGDPSAVTVRDISKPGLEVSAILARGDEDALAIGEPAAITIESTGYTITGRITNLGDGGTTGEPWATVKVDRWPGVRDVPAGGQPATVRFAAQPSNSIKRWTGLRLAFLDSWLAP